MLKGMISVQSRLDMSPKEAKEKLLISGITTKGYAFIRNQWTGAPDFRKLNLDIPSRRRHARIDDLLSTEYGELGTDRSSTRSLWRTILKAPIRGLSIGPGTLKNIRLRYLITRFHESLALEPHRDSVSCEEFGRALISAAPNIVKCPQSLSADERRILSGNVEGAPDYDTAQDNSWEASFIGTIHNLIELPPVGRRLEWEALVMASTLTVVVMAASIILGAGWPSLTAILIALVGTSVTAFIKEDLLGGYTVVEVATAKTLAKIPAALSLVSGLCLTLIIRNDAGEAFVLISLLASLGVAASAVCAEMMVAHAEAATKLPLSATPA